MEAVPCEGVFLHGSGRHREAAAAAVAAEEEKEGEEQEGGRRRRGAERRRWPGSYWKSTGRQTPPR